MKHLKQTVLTTLLLSTLALMACQSTSDKASAINQTKVWIGRYQGTLPCADCSGMETVITLFDDGQFKKTETNADNREMKFTEHGEIQWDATGNIVTLITEGNDATMYQVSAEKLVMLGADGQPAAGELVEQYTLKKQVETEAVSE